MIGLFIVNKQIRAPFPENLIKIDEKEMAQRRGFEPLRAYAHRISSPAPWAGLSYLCVCLRSKAFSRPTGTVLADTSAKAREIFDFQMVGRA